MTTVVAYTWARDEGGAVVTSDGRVDWQGARMTASDDDPEAVAVAARIAASREGELVGVTIGDGDTSWALARGATGAVSVGDVAAMSDESATAAVLAAAVRRVPDADVLVIGDDERFPAVAATVAGILGWPALLGVGSAGFDDGAVTAVRNATEGEETISVAPPVVLGVVAAAAERKSPGMKEMLAARKRPVEKVTTADLGITATERVTSTGTRLPASTRARVLDGPPTEAARELVTALRAEGAL